jgi:CHAT domain-containing protein
VSAAYAPQRVRVLDGDRAGAASLRAPEVGSARVLQILAHGIVDLERERTAGLALADGPLWCEDVEGMSAPPLVCLWVCKGAQGALRRGEDGLATLPDAFLAAGALAVVVSPARLEYQALQELARSLHAHLVAGAPPDEALRLARRQLGDGGEHGHPFYGLVHVVGLGDVRALER